MSSSDSEHDGDFKQHFARDAESNRYQMMNVGDKMNQKKDELASRLSWPLVLAVIPTLGTFFAGSAEVWSDFIMIVLILYYVYRWLSVPWTYYESARARRIIHHNSSTKKLKAGLSNAQDEERHRRIAAELRRHELAGLIWVILSPAVAGYTLQYSRHLVSNADRYVSSVNITVFILAASIKPATHLMNLLHERTIFLQNEVQVSDSQVDALQKKVDRLEKEIDHLHRAFATKKDFAQVTEDISPTVHQLSKAIKRFEKREQALKNWSEEHFATLETKMEEFDQYICYRLEQDEQHQHSHSTIYSLVLLPLNILLWSANRMTKYIPTIHRGKRLLGVTGDSETSSKSGAKVGKDQQRATQKSRVLSHSLTGRQAATI